MNSSSDSPSGILTLVAELARRLEADLYWVGGGVRDFLVSGGSPDFDFVVTQELETLAHNLAKEVGGKATLYPRFLHAVVEAPRAGRIDLGLPRRERYARPGAVPEVTPGTLLEDLARRDFTVNALAWRVDSQGKLQDLIDPFGGLDDLEVRQLRSLRTGSFSEDPSRLVRMLRFEARLGFEVEVVTAREAREAAERGALAWSNPSRLRNELMRLVRSTVPLPEAIRRMGAWLWIPQQFASRAAALLEEALAVPWFVDHWRLLIFILKCGFPGHLPAAAWVHSLQLTGEEQQLIRRAGRAVPELTELIRTEKPLSRVATLWHQLTPEELAIAAAVLKGEHPEALEKCLQGLRNRESKLRAKALIERGASPGPELGIALARTREAVLDGAIGPSEELEFAWKIWESEVARRSGERSVTRVHLPSKRLLAFLTPILLVTTLEANVDQRSREVLRHECASVAGRRELTVFGNGTVRLRTGPVGAEQMHLLELGSEELNALEAVLREVDLSEVPAEAAAPGGSGVDRCVLEVELDGQRRRFQYAALGTFSISLGSVLARVEDLSLRVRQASAQTSLPNGYEPQVGDWLEHRHGGIFEVRGTTGDDKGVELMGVDQPIVLYVERANLKREFARLVIKSLPQKP